MSHWTFVIPNSNALDLLCFFENFRVSYACFIQVKYLVFELQFFPKNEKYVSLFMGGDDTDIVDKRNKLREKIKANIIAAGASGKDLEGIPLCCLVQAYCRLMFQELCQCTYFLRFWTLI